MPWVVLVNVAAEHHIGPGRRWVEWARQLGRLPATASSAIDQSGVGRQPDHAGPARTTEPFAPEWIDDMRHVVTELAADGAQVGIVGLCSGSYSAFEVAHVGARRRGLRDQPAAHALPGRQGHPGLHRPPARGDGARQAVRPRSRSGTGSWPAGCGGSTARSRVWHAPLLVLWRVRPPRDGASQVVACRDDAQHFTEVYALRPLLWWMQRNPRFRFAADDTFDHSLLTRPAQLVGFERATDVPRPAPDPGAPRAAG